MKSQNSSMKVGVDTGRLLIIDPCNIKRLPKDINDLVGNQELLFPEGHPHMGSLVKLPFGDGTYTVEIRDGKLIIDLTNGGYTL